MFSLEEKTKTRQTRTCRTRVPSQETLPKGAWHVEGGRGEGEGGGENTGGTQGGDAINPGAAGLEGTIRC